MLKIEKDLKKYLRFCEKYYYKPSDFGSLKAFLKLQPLLRTVK